MVRKIKSSYILQCYARKQADNDHRYNTLVEKLRQIIDETDAEYLDKLADLQESRDLRLVELKAKTDYQTEEAQMNFDAAMSVIDKRRQEVYEATKQRIEKSLEYYINHIHDDKTLLDISLASDDDILRALTGDVGRPDNQGESLRQTTRNRKHNYRRKLRNAGAGSLVNYGSQNSDSGGSATDGAGGTGTAEERILSDGGFGISEDGRISTNGDSVMGFPPASREKKRERGDRLPPLSEEVAMEDLQLIRKGAALK